MRLYHLSEQGNIRQFIPKRSKKIWAFKKYVWAIHEEKIQNYLMPRQCPRICLPQKERRLVSEWVNRNEARAYIFIPKGWLEKMEDCTLFKYQFNPANFYEIDAIAGYYVSEQTEAPTALERINNCLGLLRSLDVAVTFLDKPQMEKLKKLVLQSAGEFSIIKWDNA